MKEMGWSWEQLMNIPFERYLEVSRIISLESKKEAKEQEKMEQKAQRAQ